jgi:hypothetical protein
MHSSVSSASEYTATDISDLDHFEPGGPADTELEWFFTMAESDMGNRSNFMAMLSHISPNLRDDDTVETRAEAAHASRVIRNRLRVIGDPGAGILEAAYAAKAWPVPLLEALGRITGVVVRLACATTDLPDDDAELNVLELRTSNRLAEALGGPGRDQLAELCARASVLLRTAWRAYVQVRGGIQVPVLRAVS